MLFIWNYIESQKLIKYVIFDSDCSLWNKFQEDGILLKYLFILMEKYFVRCIEKFSNIITINY